MEHAQKVFIQKNRSDLIKNTVCDKILLVALRQDEILSDYNLALLNSVEESHSRNDELWRIIQKKPTRLNSLLKIFADLQQDRVVSILSKNVPQRNDYTFLDDLKPFPVSVIRPDEEILHDDDAYNLDPFFIGLALIINVTVYDDPSLSRNGVEKDKVYMSELWRQLGYRVLKHEGRYTNHDIIEIIESFCERFRQAKHFQSCVIFIGCHGKYGKLVLSDKSELDFYSEFVHLFDKRHLKGKPKIFVVQSCHEVLEDLAGQEKVNIKDTTICVSSFRDVRLGSYFVYTFTDVVMREAYRYSFEKILDKVSQTLYRVLEPQDVDERYLHFRDLGMKKLYFNVKPDG